MLDRDIKKKINKISQIAKAENPDEVLTRYINVLDSAIQILIKHQEELIDNRQAWRDST